MIDVTKIQTFDIPPDISVLQASNKALTIDNGILKEKASNALNTLFLVGLIIGVIYLSKHYNDENRIHRKQR